MEFSNTNENICVSRNSELGFPLSISENSECYFYPAYVNHIWDPSIPHRKNIRKYTLTILEGDPHYPVSLKLFWKVSLKSYIILNKYTQNPGTFVSLYP